MRIGLAVGYFSPQKGGSEEVVERLAVGLSRLGHDVIVATSFHPDRDPGAMVVPVREFRVSGRSATGLQGDVLGYQHFLLTSDRDAWLLYAAQIWSTDAALPLLGSMPSSTVVVPCGYSGLHKPAFGAYFRQLPEFLSNADALVYMSSSYQDYRRDISAGLGGLARLIPNGADDDEFAEVPHREERRARTVLCVANHYRLKGHRDTIRAFRRVAGPEDRLVLVGEVPSRDPKVSCSIDCRIAAARDHRIILRSGAPRSEVIKWYQEADVFLFGSRVEAAPLVIVEAMASALPFVSTPVGNVADFDDSGLVVPTSRLAEGLETLLSDQGLRKRLGQVGRSRWDRDHRWSTIVGQYERLFTELVGRNAR